MTEPTADSDASLNQPRGRGWPDGVSDSKTPARHARPAAPSTDSEPCGAGFRGAPSCTCPDVVARRLALIKAAFSIGPSDMFPSNRPGNPDSHEWLGIDR